MLLLWLFSDIFVSGVVGNTKTWEQCCPWKIQSSHLKYFATENERTSRGTGDEATASAQAQFPLISSLELLTEIDRRLKCNHHL